MSAAVVVVAALVAGAVAIFVALAVLAIVRATALPERAPSKLSLSSSMSSTSSASSARRRVAFLGASLTHGKVSADFTAAVGKALDADVVNAGINGDLAWNALRRLPEVLACKPDTVVVLVGSNDVMSSLDAKRTRRYRRIKKLPRDPSIEWYRENLDEIARDCAAAAVAVVFCTLPPLGEILDDDVNARVLAYNQVIREVAAAHRAELVDVHALLVAELARANRPSPRGFASSDRLMLRSIFLRHALGFSFNRISALNRFHFLVDAIHVNEAASALIANALSSALKSR